MNLTTCWINNQTRPEEFSRASSFTCFAEGLASQKKQEKVRQSLLKPREAVSTTIDFTFLNKIDSYFVRT